MRSTVIFLILFGSILLLGCSDNEREKQNQRDFVPGEIAIGIKSTITIDQVFDLMNEKEVFIKQMSGFFNYDSLEYVKNILESKPYSDGSVYISAVDNRLVVAKFFLNMDLEAQKDWLSTMGQLELKDLGNDKKTY